MRFGRSDVLARPVDVTVASRPLRFAYVVPVDDDVDSHQILDAVFTECYSRWAGAFSVVLPANSRRAAMQSYLPWLASFDPDIIYSYVELDTDMIDLLDAECCPMVIMRHEQQEVGGDPGRGWRDRVPDFRIVVNPASSLSAIASPYARYPHYSTERPTVVTAFTEMPGTRWLRDNFGVRLDCSMAPNPIAGLFDTLCYVPADLPQHVVAGTETSSQLPELVNRMAERKAISIAMLAMAHSESVPRVRNQKWARSFPVFIGETCEDRIDAWNARHFAPSYVRTPGSIRLSPDDFLEDDLIAAVGRFINSVNFIGQGHGGPFVTLWSSSLSEVELKGLGERIRAHCWSQVSVPSEFASPVLPTRINMLHDIDMANGDTWSFSMLEDYGRIVTQTPDHFRYLPPRFRGLGSGQWMLDLRPERHNSRSRVVNLLDTWQVPRRHEAVRTFGPNLGKVSRAQEVAKLVSTDRTFPGMGSGPENRYIDLVLPSDEDFFRALLTRRSTLLPQDLRSTVCTPRYERIAISDKGKNLRGVVSMFPALPDAAECLTNSYWRRVLRDCLRRGNVFSLRQLEGGTYLPNDTKTKEYIATQLKLPSVGHASKYMRANLRDTLEYLVSRHVFYQVYQWLCGYCGNRNTVRLGQMTAVCRCDVCSREHAPPIDFEWSYMANPFVYNALCLRNGLTVLWALNYLYDLCHGLGFSYLPEVNLYLDPEDQPENEIDIAATVSGKLYAAEVKLSAVGFTDKDVEIEKFVSEMKLLTPDIALLCFEQYAEQDKEASMARQRLSEVCERLRSALPSRTDLQVLVAADRSGFNSYPTDLGIQGRRVDEFFRKISQ